MRLRGQMEEALVKCSEAIALEGFDWEAYELLGDLQMELDRPLQALEAYRKAKEFNPGRAKLEEKIGVAALDQARQALRRQRALDLAEGRYEKEPERKPAFAALLSFFIPGLGQIYNHELIKGTVLVCLMLLLFAGMFVAALGQVAQSQQTNVPELTALVGLFFQGGALWFTLLSFVVWIYAIADAIIQASKSMTSDESGMI
jgi:tetratricopeptide (TPR) repeat protein